MGLTAGAIANKISELRSTIAVFETLVAQIRANYTASDYGPGELRIIRGDGVAVPPEHLQHSIEKVEAVLDEQREELREWEQLPFDGKEEAVPAKRPVRLVAKTKKGKT